MCILAALVCGSLIGALNAFVVTKLKVLPMIVTMGIWISFKGVGLMSINSSTLSNFPVAFKAIVQNGSVLGTFLGVLLMALISNALTLFAIDTNLQNVLIGAIMVISVAVDEANRRRQK